MTKRARALGLAGVGLLWLATPVLAHPLNVYVEVADLRVAVRQLVVDLRFTPGVTIAHRLLQSIDANGDGVISPDEQAAYAARVRRDLVVRLDGVAVPLRIDATTFAPLDQLTEGLGAIGITMATDVTLTDGPHTVALENRHERATAVYLVNTLQPVDPRVHILGQDRSSDQSTYAMRFTVGPSALANAARSGGPGLASAVGVVTTFFRHGVVHILTGYDHLLFLAALVLGATTLWDLVKVVTAFTVAHSMTLTLAALDLVHVPDRLVEPLIALSIVIVALQNVAWPRHAHGRSRLAIAFVFGLFHGLGFAGGLLEVMHDLPRGLILWAIVGFSLGVEAGNQVVLLPLFASLQIVRRPRVGQPAVGGPRVRRVGSAVVSVAGLYYLGAGLAGLA